MNKYCTNCGKQIPCDANLCPYCGTSVSNQTINNNTNINQNTISPKNDVALGGLIVSIISIFCCGSLSIIGLILSIIGLLKSKKMNGKSEGAAIAGIIISSILIFLWILVIVLLFIIGTNDNGVIDTSNITGEFL